MFVVCESLHSASCGLRFLPRGAEIDHGEGGCRTAARRDNVKILPTFSISLPISEINRAIMTRPCDAVLRRDVRFVPLSFRGRFAEDPLAPSFR